MRPSRLPRVASRRCLRHRRDAAGDGARAEPTRRRRRCPPNIPRRRARRYVGDDEGSARPDGAKALRRRDRQARRAVEGPSARAAGALPQGRRAVGARPRRRGDQPVPGADRRFPRAARAAQQPRRAAMRARASTSSRAASSSSRSPPTPTTASPTRTWATSTCASPPRSTSARSRCRRTTRRRPLKLKLVRDVLAVKADTPRPRLRAPPPTSRRSRNDPSPRCASAQRSRCSHAPPPRHSPPTRRSSSTRRRARSASSSIRTPRRRPSPTSSST